MARSVGIALRDLISRARLSNVYLPYLRDISSILFMHWAMTT